MADAPLRGVFRNALIDKVTPDPPYTVCNTVYGHPQTKAQQAHAKQQRVDLDAAYIFGLDSFGNDPARLTNCTAINSKRPNVHRL